MNDNQLAIIIAGLIAGYWIVSKLFDRFRSNASQSRQPSNANGPTPGRDQYRPPSQPTPPSSDHWTQVLGVSQAADLEEIRHAYRALMTQYHPDKVASLGRELRELAEEKSKEITLAYQEALRAKSAM